MGVEKRRAAERYRAVAFVAESGKRNKKTDSLDMAIKTDGNQHAMGTHGKSRQLVERQRCRFQLALKVASVSGSPTKITPLQDRERAASRVS